MSRHISANSRVPKHLGQKVVRKRNLHDLLIYHFLSLEVRVVVIRTRGC